MNPKQTTKTSKFLSLVLRHEPSKIGINLDSAGWIDVATLLDAMARHGTPISEAELHAVVADNDKKRFAFSEDGRRVRASQGHSVEVELGYAPATPPEVLYHGTVGKYLDSIRANGLAKGERHAVHLSADRGTADKVGQRRGQPIILTVRAGQMHRDGHAFAVSPNGVWLTDHVPPAYLEVPNDQPRGTGR